MQRPSEQEIRAKKREVAIRYARSGYRPTIADLRMAELYRLLEYRRMMEYPLGLGPLFDMIENPRKLKALTAGRRLRLTYEERQMANIKTIAPYDISQTELKARQREEKRWADQARARKKRRASGALKRSKYEANAVSQTKPWAIMGMSRRTWYRKGKPLPDDVAQVCRSISLSINAATELCQPEESQPWPNNPLSQEDLIEILEGAFTAYYNVINSPPGQREPR
jgi:hypothetical protein